MRGCRGKVLSVSGGHYDVLLLEMAAMLPALLRLKPPEVRKPCALGTLQHACCAGRLSKMTARARQRSSTRFDSLGAVTTLCTMQLVRCFGSFGRSGPLLH